METKEKSYVEAISLAADADRRVALASVRVGEVLIRGVAVWRSRHGKLRVYFPSYRSGPNLYDEAIELPAELRSEIEAEVLARYREAKKIEKEKQGGNHEHH